ncbi:MAG: tetratricopeptide repeat protein [Anaerolineae bacterium]|nr:tetratricopeptide repeat protein [Anaerolineae bacterium]
MAEISLRAYIEYLDDRLDRDAYGEVIAQCRHILETYPKYVAIYKQLARALAAQENYTDALDLFQRVLSADPTDFVAHIGMSECYKEDGALDPAIWHLERAFEQVPSNSELQEALKQLYEQRDRKAPRKIQMSGGALARMYIRGKLYPQAISELTKAIAHDPERLDLQVLMAEALWHDHQFVAAGKVAAEVLRKLPYSIAANRILVQLWLHAGQRREARPFLERVKELDPYLGYEFEHDGQAAPTDAFRLLMLDYTATQVSGQAGVADWVSEIDGLEKRRDVTGPLEAPAPSLSDIFAPPAEAPARSAPEAAAPDWLQEALNATGSTPAGAAATPGALAGAEPDWLKDALTGTGSPPPASGTSTTAVPDWLADVTGEQPAKPMPSSGDEPDWLKDVLAQEPATQPAETVAPTNAPLWLPDALGQEPAAQPAETPPAEPVSPTEAPSWLQDALEQEPAAQPAETPPAEPVSPTETPAWLQDALEQEPAAQPAETPPAEPVSADETPAWFQNAFAQEPSSDLEPVEDVDQLHQPAEATSPENAPEWLSKVLSEKTPPSLEPVPDDWGQPASVDERVAPEWLDNIVSGERAPSSPSQPDMPSVVSDEWLDAFIAGGPGDMTEEAAPLSSDVGADSLELDALGDMETWDTSQKDDVPSPPEDWLTQDTGLGSPSVKEAEDRAQELPDWLAAGALAEIGESEGQPKHPVSEEAAEKELPDWLQVKPELTPEPVPVLEEENYVAPPDEELRNDDTSPEDDIPDWLASGDLDSDDALKWIEELAAKVDPNFKPSTTEEEEPAPVESEPEPVKAEAEEESELPAWLKEEAASPAAPEPAAAEELPSWLKGEVQPAAPVEAAVPGGSDLEWLREPIETAASAEAEEELPTWLQAEEKEEPKEAAPEPAGALSWLEQQAAEQGVSSEEVVSEALTPDHPPVAAPSLPDKEAEAKPITTGELPSWLKEAEAREEMARALESPAGAEEPEMAELPDLPVEADELAWLNETLKAEEQAASIDLDDILGESAEPAVSAEVKEEKEELPEWLKEPEPAAAVKEEAEEEELPDWLKEPAPVSEAKDEEKEAVPEWLKEPEPTAAVKEEAEEEELPDWLKEPAPISEEKETILDSLKEPEPAAAVKEEAEEEELPDWLKEPAPISEEKEEIPDWLKEPEPVSEAKPIEKGEDVPPWLKEPEPVAEVKAEEKEEELPVAEAAKGEELPDWLKEPEEAPVAKIEEGAEELPDWLTKPEPEPEVAEPAPVAEPTPAPVLEIEEEEELPSWLTTPEPVGAEAAEKGLADFLKAVEPAAVPSAPEPEPEPVPVAAAAPPSPPAAEAIAPPVISAGEATAQLQSARDQMGDGELQMALSTYEGLVNAGQQLDETIADLTEVAKSQVVVNPRVYRVMGDAMMGLGRMQDALEMYRKALDQF